LIGAEIDLESLAAYRKDKPFLADMRRDFVPARKLRVLPEKGARTRRTRAATR
jgi:hypothetical protein